MKTLHRIVAATERWGLNYIGTRGQLFAPTNSIDCLVVGWITLAAARANCALWLRHRPRYAN